MNQTYYCKTEIGMIGITEKEGYITEVFFCDEREMTDLTVTETPLLTEATNQLLEYFSGKRRTFDLPLAPSGTQFQQKVWQTLQTIPYGKTWSYKQVAEAIGNPKASRAVGMANNKNPIAIIIPCHRVIGANGKLVGYAGGLDIKSSLLELETRNGMNS